MSSSVSFLQSFKEETTQKTRAPKRLGRLSQYLKMTEADTKVEHHPPSTINYDFILFLHVNNRNSTVVRDSRSLPHAENDVRFSRILICLK